MSYTTIGSGNSKGLSIVGGLRNPDRQRGVNPDGRNDIILAKTGEDGGAVDGFPNEFAAEPIYPISFSGPGYMRFDTPIGIPSVRGDSTIAGRMRIDKDLTVQGDIALGGDLKTLDGTSISVPIPKSFTPVLQDASGNQATMTAQDGFYTLRDDLAEISFAVTWTSKGSMSGNIRIAGFPEVAKDQGGILSNRFTQGMIVNSIGNELRSVIMAGNGYFEFLEMNSVTGEEPTFVTDTQLADSGTLFFVGFTRVVT